jgi:hypothetical protein
MSTRTSSAAILLLLAACDAPDAAGAPQAADPDNLIDCAVSGAAAFARECVVERTPADEGLILTVRHPDGGFRRFEVTDDGTGVATADGAQAAKVSLREGGIEVAVGTDRYRFPATIADDDER